MNGDNSDKVFSLEVNLRSAQFDVEELSYYQLILSVSQHYFQACAINTLDQKCLLLQDYRFYKALNTEELISVLQQIYDGDLFLKANYWKGITLMEKGQPFTLVPREFYEESAPDRYLKLIRPKTPQDLIVGLEQNSEDNINVFYIRKALVEWFRQTYPTRDLDFCHSSAALIEGAKKYLNREEDYQMMVVVGQGDLLVSVFKEGTLEFCNCFKYQSPQDFIYYVLLVLDELGLDKDQIQVGISGQITPDSKIMKLLNIYLGEVKILTENPHWLNFNHDYDNIPNHYYFELYSAYLCIE